MTTLKVPGVVIFVGTTSLYEKYLHKQTKSCLYQVSLVFASYGLSIVYCYTCINAECGSPLMICFMIPEEIIIITVSSVIANRYFTRREIVLADPHYQKSEILKNRYRYWPDGLRTLWVNYIKNQDRGRKVSSVFHFIVLNWTAKHYSISYRFFNNSNSWYTC